MQFSTANATFRQLMGNGVQYRVPAFQRDYAWGEEEWEDLWQDVVRTLDAEGYAKHFMGIIVLHEADRKQFSLIDGQQRMTTLSLFILAALSHLQRLHDEGFDSDNNKKRIEQLRSVYIGYLDPVSLVTRSKIELNRHTNKFYQTYIVPLERVPPRGVNATEQQLTAALSWFSRRLDLHFGRSEEAGRLLTAFVEEAADRLFFTLITVSEEVNAFTVFETLNARGVRLSATDLLKNYLFSVISTPETHHAEMLALEDRWERIVGVLGDERFADFLRVYWNSRFKAVSKAELYRALRAQVSNREDVFHLVRDLDYGASIYAALRDPLDPLWNQREREALDALILFDAKATLPLLLASYERFFAQDRASFTRIVAALEVVIFRYSVICGLPVHELERVLNSIALSVNSGVHCGSKEVIRALFEVYPEDSLFKASFRKKRMRTTQRREKKIVRYVLFEVERHRSGHALEFGSEMYSIEHVLPEHPSDAWNGIDSRTQVDVLYRLGNMTLLESARNRDLGNADFATKRSGYAQSGIQITRAIAEHYAEWDERSIDARQRQMSNVAASIWRLEG